MSAMNPFLATADPERHQAHRHELKRKLAEIGLAKLKLVELESIVRKLNDDSDAAANEHQIVATRLQAELDHLDTEHVDCVMSGKASPAAAMERRRAVMAELAELNTALEFRCECNRRSITPIQREWESTRMQTASEGAVRNELASLCSAETRRRRLLNEHRLRVANSGLQAAQRAVGIHQENLRRCELNTQNGFNVATEKQIALERLGDSQFVLKAFEQELAEIHAADREIEAAALAE
jgi:hypothetical protein